MTVIVRDMPCNWRSINIYGLKETFWPSIQELCKNGLETCTKSTSILISFSDNSDIDVLSVRDWLHINCPKRFKMFNTFKYLYNEEVPNMNMRNSFPFERTWVGTNFRFDTVHDAFLFKMFWY
jgi:hypothetical protein